MATVWCSISGHGFGHAAQVVPILNALDKCVKNLQVILRTDVPSSVFEETLHVPWELQDVPQDIGCLQRGPLEIDIEGTWAAYEKFHENWKQRVDQEAKAIREGNPNLVISNISYLGIAGAFQAHYPVIAVASLSWDQVLQGLVPSLRREQQAIVAHIQSEYGKADHLIRLYPGIDMPAFTSIAEAGPSFPLAETSVSSLREILEIPKGEKTVLMAFGGIPLERLPLEHMESREGFHFLVTGISLSESFKRVHRVEDVGLPFREVMKQADVVMTKPGYATITSAVHHGIPVVYVRRHNFADEQPLVNYVHKYGRAIELSRKSFESEQWEETLQTVLKLPISSLSPPKPDAHGVASLLRKFFRL